MGRKYAIRDQHRIYFVTFTVVNWIDIFTREVYRYVLLDSLKFCIKNKDLNVHAYCVMSNHIHLILSVNSGELSGVIRDFKSFTSKRVRSILEEEGNKESRQRWMYWMFQNAGIRNQRNGSFQFWQQHNHPILLSTNDMLDQKLDYIHQNPVKSGLVFDARDWIWSSARQYAGEFGKLTISFL
ncbi:REP-associated tyrosine transposase [Persicobacter diffluens]|uniref:Transposase n=1 Tax=Persicobacter diffluens TaxID=981 RepID=A0AAN5AKZ9_9BACT|nr:transposase [Persicobacter diffluens]